MTVNIYVSQKTTRKPIPFVNVRLESGIYSFIDDTDNKGLAQFENIPDGKYNVKIRHKFYRPYTEKMFISRNSIIQIKMHKAIE